MKGEAIGFIGLGVMGEPICRNIRSKTGRTMIAFDPRPEAVERLAAISAPRPWRWRGGPVGA